MPISLHNENLIFIQRARLRESTISHSASMGIGQEGVRWKGHAAGLGLELRGGEGRERLNTWSMGSDTKSPNTWPLPLAC